MIRGRRVRRRRADGNDGVPGRARRSRARARRRGRSVSRRHRPAPARRRRGAASMCADADVLADAGQVAVDFTVDRRRAREPRVVRRQRRARGRRHHRLRADDIDELRARFDHRRVERGDRAELRDRRGADDALRRARGALLRHRRDHRAAPRPEDRRAVGYRHAPPSAWPRRRTTGRPTRRPSRGRGRARRHGPAASRALGAAARDGRPPRGAARHYGSVALDPPRLLRPHLVHARRPARDQDRPRRSRDSPSVSTRSSASSGPKGRRPWSPRERVLLRARSSASHGSGSARPPWRTRPRASGCPGPPSTGCSRAGGGAPPRDGRLGDGTVLRRARRTSSAPRPTSRFLERALPLARQQVLEHAVLQKVLETEPERLMPLITVEQHHVISLHRRVLPPAPRAGP